MKLTGISFLALLVLLVSCATPQQRKLQPVPLPPQRMHHDSFSFVPLDEPGWLVGAKQLQVSILGKPGTQPDENHVIRAFAQAMPEFKTEAEFVGFAKSVLVEPNASRTTFLRQDVRVSRFKDQRCARVSSTIQDRGAVKRTDRKDDMFIDVRTLVCEHPSKTAAIVIALSHRHYAENRDSGLDGRAEKLFGSLEFVRLGAYRPDWLDKDYVESQKRLPAEPLPPYIANVPVVKP